MSGRRGSFLRKIVLGSEMRVQDDVCQGRLIGECCGEVVELDRMELLYSGASRPGCRGGVDDVNELLALKVVDKLIDRLADPENWTAAGPLTRGA